ncbi:MAG TPA: YihY/virulence factor BrkB family protein [Bryobacteraceae bacterium]|nr:YihY/virulence factor BrkB family protein [Bryobacteraceae bacterium]
MHIVAENHELSTKERIELETRRWRPTIRYLSQTEVHVYALSIGASVLLSFLPFLIVMLTLVRDVFHLPAAEHALMLALGDYFPGDLGKFIIKNLNKVHHSRYQLTSLLLLLFTANGIFEPLEVALNRAWGVKQNRSYLRNQVLSLFLIILCGGLALGSVLLTAVNTKFVTTEYGITAAWLPLALFRLAAIPVTIVSLWVVYCVLPNRRVPVRAVFPVALLVGVGLELWKYVFLIAWPWLERKFTNEYGDFSDSVSIVVFSLLTALLVLAGAEWSARKPVLEEAALAEAAGANPAVETGRLRVLRFPP